MSQPAAPGDGGPPDEPPAPPDPATSPPADELSEAEVEARLTERFGEAADGGPAFGLGAEMSGVVWAAIQRPVGVVMTAAAVVLLGVVCLRKLPTNLMPEVAYPSLTVRTELPGNAPEEVEKLVSEPIEQRLGVLSNLVSIRSISRAGSSDVLLEFRWGTRIDRIVSETREKLDQVSLPADVEGKPLILRYDPSLDPMMVLGVAPPLPAVLIEGRIGRRQRRQVQALRAALRQQAGARQVGLLFQGERVTVRLSYDRGAALPSSASAEGLFKQAAGAVGLDPAGWRVTLAPTGDGDLATLRRVAIDELQRRLEPLKGVAAAEVQGGLEREIRVWLREDSLSARSVTVDQVVARLRAENIDAAGGMVQDGQARSLLRTFNEYRSLEEIRRTVVATREGTPIRLEDVGEVELATKEQEVITRAAGGQAVQVAIYKEATANIVAVADEVRAALEGDSGLVGAVAGQAHVEVLADNSRFIRLATSEVYQAAFIGGLLAMLVLYLFLGSAVHTLIIGLSIPLSVVATFVPMQMAGISLNVMSLGGLALGIGMLVDNSIVVLESIHRASEEGLGAAEAAGVGTQRVAGAVSASTLTTVAVFFPIAFVEGVAGQLFGDQALTVVCSLLASLVVSLFFIPMLAARELPAAGERYRLRADWARWRSVESFWRDVIAGDPEQPRGWLAYLLRLPVALGIFPLAIVLELLGKLLASLALLGVIVWGGVLWLLVGGLALVSWPARKLVDLALALLNRGYGPTLRGLVASPLLVLIAAGGGVALSWRLVENLGSELVPEVHQGEIMVHVELAVGTPLAVTDRVVSRLERSILRQQTPQGGPWSERLASVFGRVGVAKTATSDPGAGEHSAMLRLRLAPGFDTPAGEQALIEAVSEVASRIPELQIHFSRPTLLSLDNPLTVQIASEDLGELRRGSEAAAELLGTIPTLRDVRPSLREGSPEFHIRYDRDKLVSFDLDIRAVADVVRKKVHGEQATRVSWQGEKIDLWVALRREDVSSREKLEELRVDAGGQAVAKRLGEVAHLTRMRGPSEIRHAHQRRVAVIEARVAGLDLGRTGARVARELDALAEQVNKTGRGDTRFDVAGQSAEMQASLRSLAFALGLALFLVYVVMASQFESVVQPLVIMLTVPLAAIGVIVALWAIQMPISVLVLIGGIVLAGIVVNNAIVLVDAVNQQLAATRAEHAVLSRGQIVAAVADGARSRLRPVLMTTLTTILGLLPLLQATTGAELRRPLAVTLIAGLASSTALTLVVIPVLYAQVALWGAAWREDPTPPTPSGPPEG